MGILQVSLVITLGTCILFAGAKEVSYKEHWIRTKVDHFAFHSNHSFELRYLMCDKYWDRDGGPIFIYTGNENRIEAFAESAGALWEWAPEFGALIIFAEHRFFGQSLPFGKESFVSPQNLGYLTSDQALADYADLLLHLKYTLPGAERSPVVAFGGSYGGLLAAWMRLKYPHIVDAALASGGPFNMPPGLAPCSTYNEAVTKAYRSESELCARAIRRSWVVMERLASTVTGSAYLQRKFNMCQPLHPSNYTLLRDMLRDTYGVIAMSNYADASELVGALPPSPVKEVCKHFINAPETKLGLVDAAADAMGAYLTINGTRRCLDVFLYERGLDSYQFLKCNELAQPFCANGVSDMFYPYTWNATAERERCQKKFGITPDFYRTVMMFGGSKFSTATNIIFSNGELDPWSAVGIQEPPTDDVVLITIPGAAHHVDLRFAAPTDTPAVRQARIVERNYLRQWTSQDSPASRKKSAPHIVVRGEKGSFFGQYRF
ncbi:lysosomal Pro-X carboxypeptidase-like [Amblyomma americanum]